MPQPRYTPGSRNPKYRKFAKGEYVDERMAWVDTVLGSQILMYYPTPPEDAKESGPTVRVLMPQHRRPTVMWDLTFLTEDELNKLREFFELAFNTAAPIVRERDRIANEALKRGDTSFARVYRRVPQMVVRPRQEPAHSESVLDGSEDVPESDGDSDSHAGRVRGPGSGMADAGQEEGSGQDDGTETD